jgi:hypothetical protein
MENAMFYLYFSVKLAGSLPVLRHDPVLVDRWDLYSGLVADRATRIFQGK